MRILMLLSNPYLVDPRVQQEAEALVEAGNEVKIIVWDRKGEYGDRELVGKVEVFRVHNDSLMDSLPNDLAREPFWWMKAYRMAKKIRKDYPFDVIHSHDLDTLLPGVMLKRKFKVKLIFDAHEIFSFMIEGFVPKPAVWTARAMENILIPSADHIITVNEVFQRHYKRYGRPVTVVRNAKPLIYEDYEDAKNDVFTLIYIGIMSRDRFFPEIVDVVGNLEGVKLILAGKKEGLYYEMEKYVKKYPNIEFLGTIPTEQIYPLTRKADATFVLVDPRNKNNRHTVFNKQFEAMLCGRPIIVTKGTFAAEMTERYKCGLTVDYDEKSIREAIITLRDNPQLRRELGMNAFEAARKIFNWENEKKKLLEVYQEVSE